MIESQLFPWLDSDCMADPCTESDPADDEEGEP